MNKMVRIVILALFLVLFKISLFAQFAIVNDKGVYTVVGKIEKEIYKEKAIRLFYGGIIKSDK